MDNQQFKELSERLESINKNIINGTNNIASWLGWACLWLFLILLSTCNS